MNNELNNQKRYANKDTCINKESRQENEDLSSYNADDITQDTLKRLIENICKT